VRAYKNLSATVTIRLIEQDGFGSVRRRRPPVGHARLAAPAAVRERTAL